jgi:hypothetical protein
MGKIKKPVILVSRIPDDGKNPPPKDTVILVSRIPDDGKNKKKQ